MSGLTAVCGAFEPVAAPFDYSRAVVVGEYHGTEQSGPFVSALVCAALASGRSVTLAVEMPAGSVDHVDRPLASDPFWNGEYPDGRSSVATRQMLIDLAPLRARAHLNIVGFQPGTESGPPSERLAADRIRESARAGDAVIILVGSYHARRPGEADDVETLTSALGDAVNVKIANSRSGQAWACTPECGVQTLNGSSGRLPLGFNTVPAANGFDYYYVVETYTPSYPYRRR